MSDAATFQLDPQEARRLDRALTDSIAVEGRNAKQTLERFMIYVMQSGRKETKAAKKFREIKQNPDWSKGSRLARYVIVRKTQPSGEVLLPKYTRKKSGDPRVIISRRGLAKSSWTWGLRRMGKSGGKAVKGSRKFTRLKKYLTALNPRILLRINLDYILKQHPAIVRTAIVRATNRVIKAQERKLQKDLQRLLKR